MNPTTQSCGFNSSLVCEVRACWLSIEYFNIMSAAGRSLSEQLTLVGTIYYNNIATCQKAILKLNSRPSEPRNSC